ncbi:RDD family protein [Chitinilyticum aquatile]|uniref:RDD family protein n=1 Tax=Chitinilyticum aquatile TaxID=362520 RepID=UPI0003FD81D2|nr:RDD family protein [Chitinilyticum aquatile]
MSDNPYAPPQARLDDDGSAPAYVLASPARRLAAALANQILTTLVLLVALAITTAIGYAGFIAFWLILLGYFGMQIRSMVRDGQSIAKGWFGLCVVRSDGTRCDTLRYVLARELLPLLLIPTMPLLIILVFGWTDTSLRWDGDRLVWILCSGLITYYLQAALLLRPHRRSLIDLLSDTVVIRLPDPPAS